MMFIVEIDHPEDVTSDEMEEWIREGSGLLREDDSVKVLEVMDPVARQMIGALQK